MEEGRHLRDYSVLNHLRPVGSGCWGQVFGLGEKPRKRLWKGGGKWELSAEMPAVVLEDSPGTCLHPCKSCLWVCTAPGLHWGLTGVY